MTDNTVYLRQELIELALQSDDDDLLAAACVLLRDRQNEGFTHLQLDALR
jgi:hypothetical protein